jgi:rod shape-determining protein MreD
VTGAANLLWLGLFVTLQNVCLPFGYFPVDFLLLFVIFSGLKRGEVRGAWVGVLAGLCMDLIAGPPHLGAFTLAKGLCGVLAGLLSDKANSDELGMQVSVAAGLTLLHESLVMWAGRSFQLSQGGLGHVLAVYWVPKTLLHGLLAVPFFWLMNRLSRSATVRLRMDGTPKVITSTWKSND